MKYITREKLYDYVFASICNNGVLCPDNYIRVQFQKCMDYETVFDMPFSFTNVITPTIEEFSLRKLEELILGHFFLIEICEKPEDKPNFPIWVDITLEIVTKPIINIRFEGKEMNIIFCVSDFRRFAEEDIECSTLYEDLAKSLVPKDAFNTNK
ncbi:MAG TPA: hypothetical protein VM577_03010, partial [Anaerovoracaceae bacterium]|nr:hypothetical protein [Anaerovoracaceae bacterium]